MIDKKIILSVLIVALIGIIAATYQINTGEDILNPLASVETEDTPVTDALAAPASTQDDSSNAAGDQAQAAAQQQAQVEAQAQAAADAAAAQAAADQANSQAQQNSSSSNSGSGNSYSSTNLINDDTGGSSSNSNGGSSSNSNGGSSSSSNTDGTSSGGSSSNGNDASNTRNQTTSTTTNDTSTPSQTDNQTSILDDNQTIKVHSMDDAEKYALDAINPNETTLGEGIINTTSGTTIYQFQMFDPNGNLKGYLYVYPNGQTKGEGIDVDTEGKNYTSDISPDDSTLNDNVVR